MIGYTVADDRMSGLVIGSIELFFLAHDHGATLCTHHDLVFRFLELFHTDDTLV